MTKGVKYTTICQEWKSINPHLLRPWSSCKVWISYADVSKAVWHELYDHPNNSQIESDAFCALGLDVAVEESCVLDVKTGTVLIISSGPVLLFNSSLKARYLFCNWKDRLAFSSSRRSFRENTSSVLLPCISCIAGRSGTGERVCCFRYFRSSWGIFS